MCAFVNMSFYPLYVYTNDSDKKLNQNIYFLLNHLNAHQATCGLTTGDKIELRCF